MFHSMSGFEVDLVKRDWLQMLESREASKVTLRWSTAVQADGSDPFSSDQTLAHTEKNNVSCFQKQVTDEDTKSRKFAFTTSGQCVFYFSSEIDLQNLSPGNSTFSNTLVIIDQAGASWEPDIKATFESRHLLSFSIDGVPVGQAIVCNPIKKDR